MKSIFMCCRIVSIAFVLLLNSSAVIAAENAGAVATSTGKIFIVDTVGHYVMIQKTDGKRVSLELTPETQVTLDGEPLGLDQLSALQEGFPATAEHFTSNAGMQQTLRLLVTRGVAP